MSGQVMCEEANFYSLLSQALSSQGIDGSWAKWMPRSSHVLALMDTSVAYLVTLKFPWDLNSACHQMHGLQGLTEFYHTNF